MNQKSRIKLMLVEDNEDEVELLREAIQSSQSIQELRVAYNGEEAMKYLQALVAKDESNHPDLILLDLNMPKKGGMEVLKEIKADPQLKRLPVIIFTTNNEDHIIKESYDNHASCYITKPMDYDEFEDVIRRIEDFWFNIVKYPYHKSHNYV